MARQPIIYVYAYYMFTITFSCYKIYVYANIKDAMAHLRCNANGRMQAHYRLHTGRSPITPIFIIPANAKAV